MEPIQEPLPRPRQIEPHQRPSMICGFTLNELAHVALQVVGVIIAAVFGAWAIRSYDSANVANRLSENSLTQSDDANRLAQAALQQSEFANILAIINLCLYEQLRNSTTDCSAVLQAPLLASIIQRVLPTWTVTKISSRTPTLSPPTTTRLGTTTPRLDTTTPRLDTTTLILTTIPILETTTSGLDTTTTPRLDTTTTPTIIVRPDTTTPRLVTPTIPPPSSSSSRILQSMMSDVHGQTTISAPSTTPSPLPPHSDRPSPSPSPTSGSPSQPVGFGTIVGVIIAVVVTLAFICLLLIRYRRSKRSGFGVP